MRRKGDWGAAYQSERKEERMAEETYTFRCAVCGWEITVDTPELPEDFTCELCGVGPDMFELVGYKRFKC